MEHSGFSKCFPIIKSLPAVKAQVKMHTSHWAGPGDSIEEGGQHEIGDQHARVADMAQHVLSTAWALAPSSMGWMKHKLKSRLPGEISITSDIQMTLPLW